MATLKAAKFSMEGEPEKVADFPAPSRESFFIPDGPENTLDVPVGTKRRIFKLVNAKKNGRYWMDGRADIYNPATGKVERARLLTGVNTIWQSEQGHLDKEYINKNLRNLVFEDRTCTLNVDDETGIMFITLNNGFIENPKRKTGARHEYYEWNPAKQEAEAFAREIEEQEVMELAMSQPFAQVKKHASFLGGIPFVDEMGEPRSEKGIRVLYVREARKNPARFKNTLGSKEVEVAYMVKRAILDAKIDVAGQAGIKWANGGFICKLPMGRQATEYLTELALLPNDEGKQFLEQLQKSSA